MSSSSNIRPQRLLSQIPSIAPLKLAQPRLQYRPPTDQRNIKLPFPTIAPQV